MTEARGTQAAILTASADAVAARATEVALLYAYPSPAPARVTGAAMLLGDVSPMPARVTQVALLAAHVQIPCVTRWAQCWKITRSDGVVLGFTSLDRDLEFRGVTYKACASLNAGAAEMFGQPGQAGNVELTGIIDDAAISEADLFGGKYDGAEIEIWMVPWTPQA